MPRLIVPKPPTTQPMTRRWLLVATALLFSATAHGAADPWKKGPYLQWITPNSAILMWEPAGPGPQAGALEVAAAGAEARPIALGPPQKNGMYEVPISGLQPGREYTWRLTLSGAKATGRFKTAPLGRGPTTFVVYGDNRSDHKAHQAVLSRIADVVPDFLVSTGDLVGHGGREPDWAKFFEISTALLKGSPLYPVVGNHDIRAGGERSFARYFALDGNELYYAFTWGNLRFISIDAEISVERGTHRPNAAHRAWLLAQIAAAKANPGIDHIIAFVHRGPFSSQPSRTGNEGLRNFLPQMQAAGLTLMLSGHDHFYERGVSDDGLAYMVIGGGGAPLYETVGAGQHAGYRALVSRSVHSFVRFRVDGKRLTGCAVDLTGAPFDCFAFPPRDGRQ